MKSVKPKKYLGQHFLKDEAIAQKIVDCLDITLCQTLIEVGPGMGVLTKYLFQLPIKQFHALEVDADAVEFLKNQYPDRTDQILLTDFLKYPLDHLVKPVSIIGNFPYNISSQIFFRIWDHHDLIDQVVGMVQKEVAQRIASKPGNKIYGILSVLLQAFYEIEYAITVPPHVFIPPPKVQSAVVRLRRNEITRLSCDHSDFKKVVKTAFGKRRKTLRNALKDLNLDAQITRGKVFDLRAEQLTVDDFVQLTLMIFPK